MVITLDTEAGILSVAESGVRREYPLFAPESFDILSRQFLTLGWNLGYWASFSWMGRQLLQLPDDVLRLAELIWKMKPDVIVETGVYDGGSTLFFASLCRLNERGRVISVERDVRPGVRDALAGHTTLIEGDSALPETALLVHRHIAPSERVLLFLDADHSADHVLAELRFLAPLVSSGSYAIVADSNLPDLWATPNGNAGWRHDHPGRAVDAFLAGHPEFVRERPAPLFAAEYDFSALSYFPSTWLKRL